MDVFETVFKALSQNLPVGLVVLLAIACAWLVRDRFAQSKERESQLSAALVAANGAIEELHKARLADVMQIVPLTQKLVTVVELVTAARGGN